MTIRADASSQFEEMFETIMADSGNSLAQRLEAERRDLLDLSLRNSLLNFRPRAKGIEVVDESPAQLFQALVREKRRLSFAAAPGVAVSGPLPQPEEGAAADRPATDRTDFKLQTTRSSDQLQARLLAIYHAARTSLEEQGVNTLYLALGMLLWFEEESSARELHAPLILVPVAGGRAGARARGPRRGAGGGGVGVGARRVLCTRGAAGGGGGARSRP
ncbi:MAG: DUF4011 domain-containing protein, partial [Isosphaeraceae bacterium]|nr:DUF4011 domain-containing protein [Isosphaeraceae bacterium]